MRPLLLTGIVAATAGGAPRPCCDVADDPCAKLGARVGLMEGGTLGATCVNVGCVPSMTLIRAAEAAHGTDRIEPVARYSHPHITCFSNSTFPMCHIRLGRRIRTTG